MAELDERFTGRLSIRKYAVLFYDELCIMQRKDPDIWIDPRQLAEAHEIYKVMQGWSRHEFHELHRWLKRNP